MSEQSPRTRPRSNAISQDKPPDLRKQVIGDPTTMKNMGAKNGKLPDKGAGKSIGKTHNVESALDDKGKMKLDEEGKALYKRLMDEQLANPDKGKRLSSKQVKAMVKALQEDKPFLSDNPEVQKIMQREKGSVITSKQLMKDANVPEKEQNAMERTMNNNMHRQAKDMYKKSVNPLKYALMSKEQRAQGARRFQEGTLQQSGRQPEQQRMQMEMQQMRRDMQLMQQQLAGGGQQMGGRSPYPPSPMSRGMGQQGMGYQQGMGQQTPPRGQFGFMAKPVGVGKATRDIHDENPSQGTPLDQQSRDQQRFDQGGFDEHQEQGMMREQMMMQHMQAMSQKIQQLQQKLDAMEQQMSGGGDGTPKTPAPKKGLAQRIESPQPKEVEDPQTRERGKTVTEAPKKGYQGKKWAPVDTSKPKTKEELEKIADMEDQANPSRKGNKIFDRDGRVGAYAKAEKENPNLPDNQKKKQKSKGMSLTD